MATTTYKYKANNEESYNTLAEYALTLPVAVSLFPAQLTIAIPEDAAGEVGKHIDENALDFIITPRNIETDDPDDLIEDPTSDTFILREICELVGKRFKESMTDKGCELEERDRHFKALCRLGELKGRIKELEEEVAEVSEDKRHYFDRYFELKAVHERFTAQVRALKGMMGAILPED